MSRSSLPISGTLAVISAAALLGCGSGNHTSASVARNPPTPEAHRQPSPGHSSTAIGTNTTSTSTASSGKPPAPAHAQAPRVAPAPAFVGQKDDGEQLHVALRVLEERGFTAPNTETYRPQQTLRVLIGTRAAAANGHEQQAFFFEDGRYLGTDASRPSGALHLISQNDTETTLAYSLFEPSDSACCPTGGEAKVRFQLDNGRLQALDPIPPVSSTGGPSRR